MTKTPRRRPMPMAKLTAIGSGCKHQDQKTRIEKKDCNSPLEADIERFVQTLRKECLDHFVILGTKHLDHLCRVFVSHYHEERPHQSLDNEPIVKPPDIHRTDESIRIGDVRWYPSGE